MFSIVAQSILQFNLVECQHDNLSNQIDMKRPCWKGILQQGLLKNELYLAYFNRGDGPRSSA